MTSTTISFINIFLEKLTHFDVLNYIMEAVKVRSGTYEVNE